MKSTFLLLEYFIELRLINNRSRSKDMSIDRLLLRQVHSEKKLQKDYLRKDDLVNLFTKNIKSNLYRNDSLFLFVFINLHNALTVSQSVSRFVNYILVLLLMVSNLLINKL